MESFVRSAPTKRNSDAAAVSVKAAKESFVYAGLWNAAGKRAMPLVKLVPLLKAVIE